jgi:hypothetical protein
MDLYFKKYFKILWIFFLFLYTSNLVGTQKTIIYKCTGLSQFELIGSSGIKEEVKSKNYKFIDGVLHDLNNIECNWANKIIKCESNFLNIRKLSINLKNNKVIDYISGNKGLGVYVENFKGVCKQQK